MHRRTIQAYGAFWLAGIGFLWWPFALVRILLDRRQPGRRPVALLVTCACLIASLAIAVVRGAEPSRLVAASANLSVWLALSFVLCRRWERRDAEQVMRGLVDLAVFQGVLVVVGVMIYPMLAGTVLPLARLLPESLASEPNVAAFSTLQLGQLGYYGGFVVRTGGIFGTATWAGALAALAILVLLFAAPSLGPRMRRPAVRAGALVLCVLTLYWSYSRVDVLALIIATAAVVALRARRFVHPSAWLASVLIVVAAAIAILPALPLDRWLSEVNRPREGSLTSRAEIYESTIEQTLDAPTPLVGAGVKQRVEGLVASQGTHSTYLGLAYRGGLVCSISFLLFLLGLAYRGNQRDSDLALGLACFLLVWCATDDIDAGNLVPLAALIAYGLTAPVEVPKAAAASPQPAEARQP